MCAGLQTVFIIINIAVSLLLHNNTFIKDLAVYIVVTELKRSNQSVFVAAMWTGLNIHRQWRRKQFIYEGSHFLVRSSEFLLGCAPTLAPPTYVQFADDHQLIGDFIPPTSYQDLAPDPAGVLPSSDPDEPSFPNPRSGCLGSWRLHVVPWSFMGDMSCVVQRRGLGNAPRQVFGVLYDRLQLY